MMKLFILIVVASTSFALEIDSKLTLRIVNVSSSGKTILINRGVEDGLAKNDHAKFFLTTGVVARGVLVKASPTRSVWSVYRVINNGYIKPEQVMKLKITEPLKVTKDESRSLVKDDQTLAMSNDPRDLGIPIAEGGDDMSEVEMNKELSQKDMNELESGVSVQEGSTSAKFEVGAVGNFLSSTSSVKGNKSFEGNDSIYSLGLYGEYYLNHDTGIFSKISLSANYFLTNSSTIAYEGSTSTESINEFGGGISYHLKSTRKTSVLNPYANFSFLVGSATSTFTSGDGAGTSSGNKGNATASTSVVSFGAGVKYFSHIGFSFKAAIDFYSRSLDYQDDNLTDKWSKTQAGPRILLGAGYRF